MIAVLFTCVENAGRSQMAAAFFNQIANPDAARAVSAGTKPGDGIHPEVLEVMHEVGIDLVSARPRALTPDLAASCGLVVTMGCGEACPVVPGARREDWTVADPKGLPLAEVRRIRDEIGERVRRLVLAEGWQEG